MSFAGFNRPGGVKSAAGGVIGSSNTPYDPVPSQWRESHPMMCRERRTAVSFVRPEWTETKTVEVRRRIRADPEQLGRVCA